MKVFGKNIFNAGTLMFCISLLLFLGRLYVCSYVPPHFDTMDYYGYIELGKSIFNKFNFIIPWELGSPVQYPPFYSILIYLLTFFTNNFIASIQYINIFSASFCIIPLFFLVKRVLNIHCAALAAVFVTYYLGLDPCYGLWSDYFYSFLIIVISWFIMETLANKSREAWRYIFAGVLISLAYLTKYSGMIFGLASIGSIIYYFARNERSIKTGLKMSGFLLLGAAPLFISYHLLLNNDIKGKAPNISTYAFFDANNLYRGGGDYNYSRTGKGKLNAEGTEFSFLDLIKNTNEYKFSLENPPFVIGKYIWGLKGLVNFIDHQILPWMHGMKAYSGIIFQGTFIFLLMLAGLYFKWHFKMMHILFFAAGLLLIPFCYFAQRYTMPFMSFYFVLWLFILSAIYHSFDDKIKNRLLLKLLSTAVIVFFILGYCFYSYKEISWAHHRYQTKVKPDETALKIISWIKNDAKGLARRPKIMARNDYLAYLADADFVRLPTELSWERIMNFARLRDVDYIIVAGGFSNDVRFSLSEFILPRTPADLLRAIVGRRELHFHGTASSIDILNKLLEYKDLYKFMPVQPDGGKCLVV
jgi:hypothetical protein